MNITYIRHENITNKALYNIILLKDKVWSYGLEKQISWIKNNVNKSDIHVLCYKNSLLVSYLLLVPIEIEVNSEKKLGFGISSVCSVENGKGYGMTIMDFINKMLEEQEKVGLLFCKLKNVAFYQKCRWNILSPKIFEVKNIIIDNKDVFALSYNFPIILNNFKYNGKIF